MECLKRPDPKPETRNWDSEIRVYNSQLKTKVQNPASSKAVLLVSVRRHHGAPHSRCVSSLGNKVDSSDRVGPGNPRPGMSPELAWAHLKAAPSSLA